MFLKSLPKCDPEKCDASGRSFPGPTEKSRDETRRSLGCWMQEGFFYVRFFGGFLNVSAGCEPQRFSAVVAGLELEVQE